MGAGRWTVEAFRLSRPLDSRGLWTIVSTRGNTDASERRGIECRYVGQLWSRREQFAGRVLNQLNPDAEVVNA
jgi:hypothetical protein